VTIIATIPAGPVIAAAPWHEGLTERQRRFCEAFSANGGRAVAAARDAGYSKPDPEGARLLGKARIRVALERLRQQETSDAIATRQERQAMWTPIVRDKNERTRDRLKASELLGRSQGDFIQRREVTGRDGAPLATEILVKFVEDIEARSSPALACRVVAPRRDLEVTRQGHGLHDGTQPSSRHRAGLRTVRSGRTLPTTRLSGGT
jgi:phage terminase small subunit